MSGTTTWRERINQRPVWAIAVAAVIIFAGLLYVGYSAYGPSGRVVTEVYYYDLHTKQLFSAGAAELPPIDTASGKDMGVRATVYGLGDCRPDHRVIACLLRYSAATKQAQIEDWAQQKKTGAATLTPLPNLSDGLEVRSVEGGAWVPLRSSEGLALADLEAIAKQHPGAKLIPCNPGD
jgi:hypothetical protein